jgi:hypothetical protein
VFRSVPYPCTLRPLLGAGLACAALQPYPGPVWKPSRELALLPDLVVVRECVQYQPFPSRNYCGKQEDNWSRIWDVVFPVAHLGIAETNEYDGDKGQELIQNIGRRGVEVVSRYRLRVGHFGSCAMTLVALSCGVPEYMMRQPDGNAGSAGTAARGATHAEAYSDAQAARGSADSGPESHSTTGGRGIGSTSGALSTGGTAVVHGTLMDSSAHPSAGSGIGGTSTGGAGGSSATGGVNANSVGTSSAGGATMGGATVSATTAGGATGAGGASAVANPAAGGSSYNGSTPNSGAPNGSTPNGGASSGSTLNIAGTTTIGEPDAGGSAIGGVTSSGGKTTEGGATGPGGSHGAGGTTSTGSAKNTYCATYIDLGTLESNGNATEDVPTAATCYRFTVSDLTSQVHGFGMFSCDTRTGTINAVDCTSGCSASLPIARAADGYWYIKFTAGSSAVCRAQWWWYM